jgi:putative membrane-bound dehydrogenase-like protein
MVRCFAIAFGLALTAVGLSLQGNPHIVATLPLAPSEEVQQFQVPPGFTVQLVASEPAISKPMNLSFDDQGRLWVTDTLEYPFPNSKNPRDTVKVLSDFGPDGKARSIRTFADGLNIPIGVLPLSGKQPREALVFSIPYIYRLRDTVGKGVSDHREVLYGTYDYRDTHGMTNAFLTGLDGWIYACHGFANTSTIKSRDGSVLTMNSGNTYRFRPDGSRLEQYTWGQVNPFGLGLDEYGYLYSSDCHSEPIYQLIRGGYYPSFGKPHDGLGFAPQMFTGYKGSTAIAGMALCYTDAFPPEYQGAAFVGDVVTNEIVQFRSTWSGSTPAAKQLPFLRSKDRWFRPVDMKFGPDGALYVADFYNRIIGHYEVPLNHPGRDRHRGRIWRIVYTGDKHKPTPSRSDFTSASLAELIEDLAHPALYTRLMAAQQLGHRPADEVARGVLAVLNQEQQRPESARQLAHGLWVLHGLGRLDGDLLARLAGHRSDLVRTHVQRILAETATWKDRHSQLAQAGLKDSSAHVQRAAADALGQHPQAAHIRPLLALRHVVPAADSHLLHTVRIALRNQLRPADNWKQLGQLDERDARAIADVALGVPSAESAGFLLGHIRMTRYSAEDLARLVHHIARHGKSEQVGELVRFCQGYQPEQLPLQAQLLRAVTRGIQERGVRLPQEAQSWAENLIGRLLDSTQASEQQLAIELIARQKLRRYDEKLLALASAAGGDAGVRQSALTTLLNFDVDRFAPLLGQWLNDSSRPLSQRQMLANLLAQVNRPAARMALLGALPTAPAQLQTDIAAGLSGSREGAEALFEAISKGKASPRVLQERAVVVRLESTHFPGLKEKIAALTAGMPSADARLSQLLVERRKSFLQGKADSVRGAAVFEKHCASCHQVAGKGAKVGPQLDGIGLRGLDRLLEDTLDPNRNVDQAFRTTFLTLRSGRSVQGLLLREEGAVLVLADQQGKEVRVAKDEVEERQLSPLSPMPANFSEQIALSDFADLMAYLLSLRPSKP